jgi:hypothetical protein
VFVKIKEFCIKKRLWTEYPKQTMDVYRRETFAFIFVNCVVQISLYSRLKYKWHVHAYANCKKKKKKSHHHNYYIQLWVSHHPLLEQIPWLSEVVNADTRRVRGADCTPDLWGPGVPQRALQPSLLNCLLSVTHSNASLVVSNINPGSMVICVQLSEELCFVLFTLYQSNPTRICIALLQQM